MKQNREIKSDIYYVGVNDRQKRLFEQMWPLPYGVSYNSYLIVDEMIALVDTVDVCFFERYLASIKKIIGDKPINYLIINHMEPDHSGAIRLVRQAYPDIIIVGNKQTFGMVEGFYGIAGDRYEVKHGDFLSLGKHTLRFLLTPMVHWPETMMTFDERNGVLFSGDAFGSYGTLDGGVIDHNMNVEHFRDEMIRYYSTIVGKYGSPVQAALQKLKEVEIKMICSTHGPVWEDKLDEVVALYDRMSRYDTDEGVVIAYGSMYGHTEEMAEAVAEAVSAEGIRNVVIYDVSKTSSSYILMDIFKYKGLIVGCPTYCNQIFPEVESLLGKISVREIKNHYFGYFGSFTWAGAAVKRIGEWAEKSKMEIVGNPVEMRQAIKDITFEQCYALGKAMAERLKKDRK